MFILCLKMKMNEITELMWHISVVSVGPGVAMMQYCYAFFGGISSPTSWEAYRMWDSDIYCKNVSFSYVL